MSKLQGTIVTSPITPADSADTFPTHDAQYGKGGYRSVATVSERDAIPDKRRTIGMIVRVEAEGKEYIYRASGWEEWVPSGAISAEDRRRLDSVDRKLEKIQIAGTELGVANHTVNIPLATTTAGGAMSKEDKVALSQKANQADVYTKAETDTKISTAVSSVYKPKGSKSGIAEILALTDAKPGDVWNVESEFMLAGKKYPASTNVVCVTATTAASHTDANWDTLGGTVDLTPYAKTADMTTALSGKVDKVSGQGLSQNSYTTAEKTKLGGISTGAQVNVIERIQHDGTDLTVTGKKVNIPSEVLILDLTDSSSIDTLSKFNEIKEVIQSGKKSIIVKSGDTLKAALESNFSTDADGNNIITIRVESIDGNFFLEYKFTHYPSSNDHISTGTNPINKELDWSQVKNKPTQFTPIKASETTIGGVRPGDNINFDTITGIISTHDPYTLPVATRNTLGGVRVGDGLSLNGDTLYIKSATATERGLVMVPEGSGLKIDQFGNLSVTGTSEAGSVKWENITGRPTWIGTSKPTYSYSEISGAASASSVTTNANNITALTTTVNNLKTGTGASGTWGISVTGNAATATKLQTGRTINGTSFDGTANITTETWGEARDITIGDKIVSIDGSTNVKFSRNDIKAAYGQEIWSRLDPSEGWYRIATSPAGIGNCSGIFSISVTTSVGYNSVYVIYAGTLYGHGVCINQIGGTNFESAAIMTKARLIYHTTYDGNYAYLEIYSGGSQIKDFDVKLLGGSYHTLNNKGWSLIDTPTITATIPDGYSSKEITLQPGAIVADNFIGTSFKVGDKELATQEWVTNNAGGGAKEINLGDTIGSVDFSILDSYNTYAHAGIYNLIFKGNPAYQMFIGTDTWGHNVRQIILGNLLVSGGKLDGSHTDARMSMVFREYNISGGGTVNVWSEWKNYLDDYTTKSYVDSKTQVLTMAEYNALVTKDSSTVYYIVG